MVQSHAAHSADKPRPQSTHLSANNSHVPTTDLEVKQACMCCSDGQLGPLQLRCCLINKVLPPAHCQWPRLGSSTLCMQEVAKALVPVRISTAIGMYLHGHSRGCSHSSHYWDTATHRTSKLGAACCGASEASVATAPSKPVSKPAEARARRRRCTRDSCASLSAAVWRACSSWACTCTPHTAAATPCERQAQRSGQVGETDRWVRRIDRAPPAGPAPADRNSSRSGKSNRVVGGCDRQAERVC